MWIKWKLQSFFLLLLHSLFVWLIIFTVGVLINSPLTKFYSLHHPFRFSSLSCHWNCSQHGMHFLIAGNLYYLMRSPQQHLCINQINNFRKALMGFQMWKQNKSHKYIVHTCLLKENITEIFVILQVSWSFLGKKPKYKAIGQFLVVWQPSTLANWNKRLTFSFLCSLRDLIYNLTLILVKAISYLL